MPSPDAVDPGSRLFRRGTLVLACRDTGGDGLPVVFQHGLCADSRQSFELLPDRPDVRRLALDCRGHGASDRGPDRELSLASFADDVAALIEDRVGGPAVVGGTSMGAAVALRLSVRRPDLARALILVRPAWTTGPAPDNLRPYAEVGRLLAGDGPDAAGRTFEAGATAAALAAHAPETLDALRALLNREPAAVTASLLCRIAADGPGVSGDDLRRIAVPTLVIGRRADPLHPVGHAEALARAIPGARAIILASAPGHDAQRAAIRAALDSFLAGLVARAAPPP